MIKRPIYAGLLAALLAAPVAQSVAAESPMSGAEFEAYVLGKTLTFGVNGQAYGIERYLRNRRVVWAFVDGECQDGFWYEETAGEICFLYDFDPDPQCWQFFKEGGQLRAVFTNDPGQSVLYEAQDESEPLFCPGPDVGA